MKQNDEQVWIGLEQLQNPTDFQNQQEFNHLSVDELIEKDNALEFGANRRDFLKYLGFGIGAATVAASCEIPIKKALPYVIKPDAIVPGVASYYATTFVKGSDACPIIVRTREGRPIKVEGNALSSITNGGTSARAQASVLELYDSNRYQKPMTKSGDKWSPMSWVDMDKAIIGKLATAKGIRILTNSVISPTGKAAIAEFQAKYPNSKVVSYDPVSVSGLLDANQTTFGQRVVPGYSFDKADIIVSFDCDFLGTWIAPEEFARQFAKTRKIVDVKGAKMSRLYQVESRMSLTGSNADNRIMVKPSEQGAAIAALYGALSGSSISSLKLNEKASKAILMMAADLKNANGRALIVSSSNNMYEQILVNKINDLIGSYGNTIDFGNAILTKSGDDKSVQTLISDINAGGVDVVMLLGANPVYDLPNGEAFKTAFAKVGTKVSLAYGPTETTDQSNYIAPIHHYLEAWGDAEIKRGHVSVIQPTISPLFSTRQWEESMLVWAASANLDPASPQPYYEYLKKNWKNSFFRQQSEYSTFNTFWDSSLHDGLINIPKSGSTAMQNVDLSGIASKITQPSSAALEISFYEPIGVGDGKYADNPWLQEMPDPITRCTWGNYVSVPIGWDGGNEYKTFKDLKEGDLVDLTVNGIKQRVAVVTQFGQMAGTIAMPVGYGRKIAGMAGINIGYNAYPWLSMNNGYTSYISDKVEITGKQGVEKDYACVQYHHTMGVTAMDKSSKKIINVDEKTDPTLGSGYQGSLTERTIIKRSHINELPAYVEELKEKRAEFNYLNTKTLYPSLEQTWKTGLHWGLHVDLNACTGCGACTVACMAENNVPVVGKHEVHRHHEMSWLRIDRYFYGDLENPKAVYQPMMCQHCDNAPCENVCPVAATNHSAEGINQMTYNRCIGTRYCANNCPFKVRRFNWLDYTGADLFGSNEYSINGEELRFGADNLTRMVLNPDVTVRTRGVIEKCSFCIQRIQEGKLAAKRESRPLREGDVKSACQTACPTGAITFGNVNDAESEVSKRFESELNYIVLEEINVAPGVQYSLRVHNSNEKIEA